jgi:Na+-transporting NADH:ubiquinone oxidoreductase subunit NqrF
VSTQIEIHGFKTNTCDIEIKTKYHDELNKHELVVNGKKYQLVGTICPYSAAPEAHR